MTQRNKSGRKSKRSSDFSKWARKDLVKPSDETFHGNETDIIIPVIGITGVGKSTFINALLGRDAMEVGHDIVSCTTKIQSEVVDKRLADQIYPNLGDRRLIIVDTPGFDDTFVDDSEILRRIAVWLASSYAKGTKLGGIIYLQNIAKRRMEGTSRRNLEMFKKLCGTDALHAVILGTTSWQDVGKDIGDAREDQLKSIFWKEMIARGSTVVRFHRTQQSAIDILRHILRSDSSLPKVLGDPPILQIQKELVDMKKSISQTDAAKEIFYSIEHILKAHREIMMQKDEEMEKEMLRRKVQALETQVKSLRLPFFIRLKSSLGLLSLRHM